MMLSAEEVTNGDIAGPVVVIVFLIAGIVYAFGYRRAVMHRANKDYKGTKAAVPVLRKGFWSAWWKVAKATLIIALIAFALFSWWIRGAQKDADANPKPTPSSTVSRAHR